MKHRFGILLPMLLILLLSGCSCNHEWSDANCLNPQVCTKCGEAGQAALGHNWVDATCAEPEICTRCGAVQGSPFDHDWAEATCTAPEICTRCGVTQGEALGHSFSDWVFGEDDMTHTCSVCTFTESTEIDRELYLDAILPGYWDLWSVDHLDDDDPAHAGAPFLFEGGDRITYLNFGEDRSCQIIMSLANGNYKGAGVWELANYIDSGDEELYQIYVYTTEPKVDTLIIELHVDPDGMNTITFTGGNFIMWFYQEQEDILEIICNNWAINEHFVDHSYCFQLHPDRTATCYVEGVFEGTWCIGAYPEDRNAVGFAISYVRNGEEELFQGYIQLRGSDVSAPTLYLLNGTSYLEFLQVSDSELTIIQNATDMLAGTWTSIGFGSSNPEFADSVTSDYSITITKNNKVTLNLADGRTYTGSWAAYACSEGHYQYYLYLNEVNKTVTCILEARSGEPNLRIHLMGTDSDALFFKQMSEQELAGFTLPVGSWTSRSIFHEGDKTSTQTEEYSFTFREDGTFTAQLEQEVSGTWNFLRYLEHTLQASDSPDPLILDDWTYRITPYGESEYRVFYIEEYRNNPGLYLTILITDSESNKITYHFSKD